MSTQKAGQFLSTENAESHFKPFSAFIRTISCFPHHFALYWVSAQFGTILSTKISVIIGKCCYCGLESNGTNPQNFDAVICDLESVGTRSWKVKAHVSVRWLGKWKVSGPIWKVSVLFASVYDLESAGTRSWKVMARWCYLTWKVIEPTWKVLEPWTEGRHAARL